MYKTEKESGRVFIVEPSLLLKVGHVELCTELFASKARELGYEPIVLIPESAPNNLSLAPSLLTERVLPNTYESLLIHGVKFNYPLKGLLRVICFFFGKRLGGKVSFFIDRLIWFTKYGRESKAVFVDLNKKYAFNSFDRVIFPNADHLTLRAYLKFSKKLQRTNLPKVAVRFINVMENNGIPKLLTSKSIFRLLGRWKLHNYPVSITAETESYRSHISRYIQDVFLCEYPHEARHKLRRGKTPVKLKSGFVIGALGSARPDKGFDKLSTLLPKVLSVYGEKVTVLTQEAISPWGYEYEKTIAELRQYPQVNLLPGYLAIKEMQDAIESCDLLLMPYDENVYEFRGSAMLFEAADRNIPMLVPSRTGLGEVVRKYGIGTTYNSASDIVSSLESLLSIDSKTLKFRFETYNNQRIRNFRKLIEG